MATASHYSDEEVGASTIGSDNNNMHFAAREDL